MNIKQMSQKLAYADGALENISARGRQNVLNLAAAFQLLDDVRQELSREIEAAAADKTP